MPYAAVRPEVLEELRRVCGREGVIIEQDRLARYARDQVVETRYHASPEVAVLPQDAGQVQEVLRLANRQRIPVTPRGAGSGLSGGAIPIHGGICLSLERMNRILEIDPANLTAVVEPGVVTNRLDEALRPHGLFFAGYPLSEEICSLGGNVAENAGGGRAVKYGVTGRYVTGLEVVTPSGELLQLGGKRFKDVTGYDLIGLMVGSEGTLGIFTRITLRLLPRPLHRRCLLALFPGAAPAIQTVTRILIRDRLVPSAAEFMDSLSFSEACRSLRETLPYPEAGAALLLEADGWHAGQVQEEAQSMRKACLEGGALQTLPGDSEAEAARFWKIRKQVPWSLRALASHQSIEDIVVPVGRIMEMLERLQALRQAYALRIPVFGHAGDGNLHAHPLKNPGDSVERWQELLPRLLADLYREAAALGGTISGEHGIGHKRKPFLPLVMEPARIEADAGHQARPGSQWHPESRQNLRLKSLITKMHILVPWHETLSLPPRPCPVWRRPWKGSGGFSPRTPPGTRPSAARPCGSSRGW